MLLGPQASAVRPGGMRKKKQRYASIVQEQARQGLATRTVMADKEAKMAKEQATFEKDMSEKQFKQQKKQNKYGNIIAGAGLAVSAASTAYDIISSFF